MNEALKTEDEMDKVDCEVIEDGVGAGASVDPTGVEVPPNNAKKLRVNTPSLLVIKSVCCPGGSELAPQSGTGSTDG